MSILTFRGLSHVKMYQILSSSGKSKVEQCAIEKIKSDLKMKSSLSRGHSAGRDSSASACRHMKLPQYFSLKPIARPIFISKPFLLHESTVNIGHYRKIF